MNGITTDIATTPRTTTAIQSTKPKEAIKDTPGTPSEDSPEEERVHSPPALEYMGVWPQALMGICPYGRLMLSLRVKHRLCFAIMGVGRGDNLRRNFTWVVSR